MLWATLAELRKYRDYKKHKTIILEEKSIRESKSEKEIDRMIEDSFPASDPMPF